MVYLVQRRFHVGREVEGGQLILNKDTWKKESTEVHRQRLKELARKEREMIVDGTIYSETRSAYRGAGTRPLGPNQDKIICCWNKDEIRKWGVRKRKVVIENFDALVKKVTENVLATIPTLQSGTCRLVQSICALGGSFDEFNEIELHDSTRSLKED
ncbi:hypothetical protein CTI12_AA353290 [Artemisia annua]|uniref:Uncharacterized protein n=1 Tax=Artemisia annua TaxID=35608 RepID=A0A2U1MQE1_ARTAN|nr:hypothetical protein CTI12_AA353290 [Artemisia annua]